MPFRRRVTVLTAAAVAIAVIAAAASAWLAARAELRGEVDDALRDLGSGAVIGPSEPTLQRRLPPLPKTQAPTVDETIVLPAPAPGGATGYAQLVTSRGEVLGVGPQDPRLPVDGRALAVARGEDDAYFTDVDIAGSHLRVLTLDQGQGIALRVARPLDEVDESLQSLGLVLGAIAIAGIAIAAGLGIVISRSALRPVRRLTETAEHITNSQDLSHRMDVRGNDEVARLASSFNAMMQALGQSRASQRQLVADASHELRTPLAGVRTNLEWLMRAEGLSSSDRRAVLDQTLEQVEELGELLGDVVELARDQEHAHEVEEVRLDELVDRAVARVRNHQSETDGEAVRFDTELEPCVVGGVPSRLERALVNLLDNARKWSPPGEVVDVTVRDATVTVRDRGPGIAPAELSRVFDRFYRGNAARGAPGSGLGLAIVRQVVEAHSGSVRAANAPGGGALFEIRLGSTSGSPAS